jgi:integrase
MTSANVRALIRSRLKKCGITPSQYSTHSFRRGGATEAAKAGIQDSTIQRHGRWKSTCFMRYTQMERCEAGQIITNKI